jgi:hypothetical protein
VETTTIDVVIMIVLAILIVIKLFSKLIERRNFYARK